MARERDQAKMELGASMELGGRGKSTLEKKTSFYRRGSHPTVTPKTASQRAVLPQVAVVLPLDPAVLPLPLAVLPPSLGGLEERAGIVPSTVLPRR